MDEPDVPTVSPLEAALTPEVRRRILAPEEAAEAVRRGIVRAAKDCELWGGDWPSDRGCENLLQVRSAEELFAELSARRLGSLTLEELLVNVTWAGTSKRGRPHSGMTDQQRADIAIWSRSDNIYALVEIKRAETDQHWKKDLVKLSQMLSRYSRQHNNHLRYCIFGAYISKKTAAEVRSRESDLKALATEVAKSFGLRAKPYLDTDNLHRWKGDTDDIWTCGAATVTLTN